MNIVDNKCPICGCVMSVMIKGLKCSQCGYTYILPPAELADFIVNMDKEEKKRKTCKRVLIVAAIILVGWIIPMILLNFLK